MQSKAETVAAYIKELPNERQAAFKKLRAVIKSNLPKGLKEEMQYGMVGYVVPLSTYPDGYHCAPGTALPFMHLANQKGSINLYHMGIYADKKLLDWFVKEYPKHTSAKLDMGKSCIRFKKMDAIPYQLVGELVQKMKTQEWISLYEARFKK